jgi:hypothetical protein
MDDADSMSRPSLIALQPARLAAALRSLRPTPRELLPQSPRPTPLPHGWGVLPATSAPLLLDTTGMEVALIAMLLDDLERYQRERNKIPLLIIPPAAVGVRHLVASGSLCCVVIAANAPAETIVRWASAPVQMMEGQVWVKLAPPRLPHLDPRLIPLLAALSRAHNIGQAAEWCYLSQRTVYNILTQTCNILDLTLQRHHLSTAQWVSILTSALSEKGGAGGQPLSDGSSRPSKHRPTRPAASQDAPPAVSPGCGPPPMNSTIGLE